MGEPWNLPYEEIPDGPVWIDAEFVVADGFTVRAAFSGPTPAGSFPLLILSFTNSAGDIKQPDIALLGPPEALLAFADMVRQATRSAIRANRQQQGGHS